MASNYETSEFIPEAKTLPKFLDMNSDASSIDGDYIEKFDDKAAPPIFSKRKMLLRIPQQYTGDIMHLTVSKNWLFAVLTAPPQITLLRYFLPRAAIQPAEIPLEKYLSGYKISKLFVDHTGHHLLISLVPESQGLSADFLYIHGNGPKIRRIEKFKDHEITAVAFNHYTGNESTTGPILLGTSLGLIFETELMQEADKPLYRKQVYDLGLGRQKYPITGLKILHVRDTNKYVVIASAIDCVYTFQETFKPDEKLSLQSIFAPYVNGVRVPELIEEKTDLSFSVFRCFAHPNEKYPTQWGWLCGAGIRTGEIASDMADNNEQQFLLANNLISLDYEQIMHLSYEERRQRLPKTFVLTEYHALILYSDHITGICLLNQAVIYEEYFHEQIGKLLNIIRDPFTGAIYLYTGKTIFNYQVTQEQRNIWKMHLQKGNYDLAEVYAAENPAHLNVVLDKKAEMLFSAKDYIESAQTYAKTNKTFEEICLKFMELEDKHPIILYVQTCLQNLKEDYPTQIKVLVIWLIDLYLTQINFPGRIKVECQQWQSDFDEFMQQPRVKDCVRENYSVVYKLMAEHADAHNLSQLAIAHKDYESVINQHLNGKNYSAALFALGSQKDPELYYKYCPILMEEIPHETVELLMAQGRKLQIKSLIPTLIAIDTPKHIEEIMKYLEFAIYKLGESNQTIHNFLLRLYAEHQPDKLLTYLENEGHDVSLVHYEIYSALSVCVEFNAKVASVFLQCLLEMWSAAVELALSFNVQLAKETASKPKDEALRRKLWLRIAHHDIKGTDDVKKALALLKECDLLRIEDLLPLFSDFEKIDDFKEPICSALKEYNQKIQELQHDMEESLKQADRVRNDLQSIRERSVRIDAQALCAICENFLLVKPFFIFPCGHKFHSDCLEKQITPILSSEKSRKLTMLKQELESILTQTIAMAGQSSDKQQQKREQIKAEVEQILAANCFYCVHMIETIDQPFCEDWEQVNVDWE